MNYYLVMEYFENGTLFDYMHSRGATLSEQDAKCISTQLLQGIQVMHESNYVHRDIKPSVSNFFFV